MLVAEAILQNTVLGTGFTSGISHEVATLYRRSFSLWIPNIEHYSPEGLVTSGGKMILFK